MASGTGFYKGIAGFYRAQPEELELAAAGSVYGWWWRYLRLSPALWYAQTTGHRPTDSALAATLDVVGDLKIDRFERWWQQTGQHIFVEARRPEQVRIIAVDEIPEHRLYPKSLVIEVPLTTRRTTVLSQLKAILDKHHHAREQGLLDRSSAALRLHTKLYRLPTLERSYLALLYRLLYPKLAVWRIGDRLQLAPSIRVRGVERGAFTDYSGPFVRLHSLTGRYIYKAQYMLHHVERGTFPRTTPVTDGERREKLFAAHHQRDFEQATQLGTKPLSPWAKWLDVEMGWDLRNAVIRRNHLTEAVRLPGSRARRELPAFIAGEREHIG